MHELRRPSSPDPEGLGLLLVEGHGRLGAGDLEEQPVLAAGGDLADDDGSRHAGHRSEHDDGDVLGRHRARAFRRVPSAGAEGVDVLTADAALRESRHQLRAHRGEPVTGHEFDQIAPVRADVGEGTGWSSEGRVDAPVVVLLRRQPVLQIGAVDEPERAEAARHAARGPRAPAGRSGTRRAPWRRRPRGRPRTAGAWRTRGRGRAASRRSHACPPPGRARLSGAWSWFGVQMWTTSMSARSPATRRRRRLVRHRVPRPLPSCCSGVEAATPTMLAPARRAALRVDGTDEAGANNADPERRPAVQAGKPSSHAPILAPTYVGCQAELASRVMRNSSASTPLTDESCRCFMSK